MTIWLKIRPFVRVHYFINEIANYKIEFDFCQMENRGYSLNLFLLGLFKPFISAKLKEISPENVFLVLIAKICVYFHNKTWQKLSLHNFP